VLMYSSTATGTGSSIAELNGKSGMTVTSIFVDNAGQIYLAGYIAGYTVVDVYAAGATGSANAIREITYPTSAVADVVGADSSGNVYVGDNTPEIVVFSSSAGANATPTRIIEGSATGLTNIMAGMGVDGAGDVYVSGLTQFAGQQDGGVLLEFGPAQTGNVSPLSKQLVSNNIYEGMAVTSGGMAYVVRNAETNVFEQIDEYTGGTSGALSLAGQVTASGVGLSMGGGIAVDGAGNLYMVASNGSTQVDVLSSTGSIRNSFTPSGSTANAGYGELIAVH
jgi:hypothetical protein